MLLQRIGAGMNVAGRIPSVDGALAHRIGNRSYAECGRVVTVGPSRCLGGLVGISARNECVILILLEYAVSDWIRDGRIVGSVNKLSRIVELVGLRIDNAGRSVYGILNYPELGICKASQMMGRIVPEGSNACVCI